MIKLLMLMCFLSPAVFANTAVLGTDDCGTLKQCLSVPNDQGLDISIYAGIQYPWVHLYIDGVAFYAPSGNGMVLDNLAFQDPDGNIVYLSGTFTNYKTCTRSGRGQTCLLHWSFVGGTLAR